MRFYFEAGQLKQALVSDQNRMGTVIEHYGLQAYKVKVKVSDKNHGIIRSDHIGFIVNATDADAAREACFGWIDLHREDDETVDKVTIIDAKPLNCTKVIEREFSMSYVDAEANNSNNN